MVLGRYSHRPRAATGHHSITRETLVESFTQSFGYINAGRPRKIHPHAKLPSACIGSMHSRGCDVATILLHIPPVRFVPFAYE